MNYRYSALALSALALGGVALTATEASAMLKDPGGGSVTAVEPLTAPSPSNDNGFEGVQLGASALGGAGVAFGGMWLYRRRHLLAG